MNNIILNIIAFLTLAFAIPNLSADEATNEYFIKFSAGDFVDLELGTFSGWVMESEDGESYHRAFLNKQASMIEEIGIDAIPVALKYLSHKHMHIRYIAAESLRRITKQKPIWYNFGTPGKVYNGNETWSRDAMKEWSSWYEVNKPN